MEKSLQSLIIILKKGQDYVNLLKNVRKNINIIGFEIGEEPEQSFEKMKETYDEHKLKVKDNGHI